MNVNATQKSFIGPKCGRFHELEKEIVEFVVVTEYKAWELAKSRRTVQYQFKASKGYLVHVMHTYMFCLH
jgi:hypothetical protein